MARKDDYIPSNDQEMAAWLNKFERYVTAHLAELKLTAEEVAFLPKERAEFEAALAEFRELQDRIKAAMNRKTTARRAIESHVRPLARQIGSLTNVDNEIRSEMGLNPVSDHRVRHEIGNEAPQLEAKPGKGRVAVHFGTTPGNELLNGKPKWALGCNIYRKKAGEEHYHMVGFATSSPFIDRISDEVAVVTYIAAYRGRRNHEEGTQSQPCTVAVTGSIKRQTAA